MSEFQGEGVTDLTSYRLGVLAERERIVKLLEEQMDDGGEHLCETCDVFQTILKGGTK